MIGRSERGFYSRSSGAVSTNDLYMPMVIEWKIKFGNNPDDLGLLVITPIDNGMIVNGSIF